MHIVVVDNTGQLTGSNTTILETWQMVSIAGSIAAKATWDASRHAADAAVASDRALIVSQRPWLSVEPRLGEHGFQFHVGRELRFILDLQLWNNGRSPADDIKIFARFCPISADATAAFQELRTAARAGTTTAAPLLYIPLFPQDMQIYPLPIYMRSADNLRELPKTNLFDRNHLIDPAVVGLAAHRASVIIVRYLRAGPRKTKCLGRPPLPFDPTLARWLAGPVVRQSLVCQTRSWGAWPQPSRCRHPPKQLGLAVRESRSPCSSRVPNFQSAAARANLKRRVKPRR
jgi:hypothetical protein